MTTYRGQPDPNGEPYPGPPDPHPLPPLPPRAGDAS